MNEKALELAAWEFVKAWPKYTNVALPAAVFNRIKPLITDVIEKYMEALEALE